MIIFSYLNPEMNKFLIYRKLISENLCQRLRKNQSGAPINHARAEILRHLELKEEKSVDDSGFLSVQFSADDFSFTTSRQRAILNK